MFFIGKISDHSMVHASGTYNQGDPSDPTILAWAVQQYGGTAGNYSVYHIADNSAEAARVMQADEYVLAWTGNAVTGLDFAVENNKRWVRLLLSKAELIANGADSATLTVQVWKADKSGIDTVFNAEVKVPLATLTGTIWTKVTIASGVGTKIITIQPEQVGLMGMWTVPPSSVRFNNVRVYNQVTLNVLLA